MNTSIKLAITDIIESFKKIRLVHVLAWNDIKQRYRRTILGPIWISLSTLVTIIGLGLLFGVILNQKTDDYLAYLAVGILFWNFNASVIQEGGNSIIEMERMVKQFALPYSLCMMRVMYRNILILIHNLIIAFLIFYMFDKININFNWQSVFQIILGMAVLGCIVNFSAIISTRYRDIQPISQSVMQLFFYLTPIIWKPEQIAESKIILTILTYNPFYYILQALRSIIEGVLMPELQIMVLLSMLGAGIIINTIMLAVSYKKIAFWI